LLEGPSRARWAISASLEATPQHQGQTTPPPNRSPYEGIKSQPLRHGSKDRRRQAATPTVDVTGVPSADSGHHSAIPDAVAAPWDLRRGTRQARHCSHYCSADTDHPDSPPTGEGVRRRHVSLREGRPARNGQSPGPSPLFRGPGPPRVPRTL